MCDLVSRVASDPSLPASNRRQFLAALTGVTATAGLSVAGAGTAHATGPEASRSRGRRHRTRLVLLGTAGGPPSWGASAPARPRRWPSGSAPTWSTSVSAPTSACAQSSLGAGAGPDLAARRGPRPVRDPTCTATTLVDWPAVYATGVLNTAGPHRGSPRGAGPGTARHPDAALPPPAGPEPAVFHPEDPTPGITAMTEHLTAAWAADFNDRARDSGFTDPRALFDVQDIDLSGVWGDRPRGQAAAAERAAAGVGGRRGAGHRHPGRPPPHGSLLRLPLRHHPTARSWSRGHHRQREPHRPRPRRGLPRPRGHRPRVVERLVATLPRGSRGWSGSTCWSPTPPSSRSAATSRSGPGPRPWCSPTSAVTPRRGGAGPGAATPGAWSSART